MNETYICITSKEDYKTKFLDKYTPSNIHVLPYSEDYPYLLLGIEYVIDNDGYRPDTIKTHWYITRHVDPEIIQFVKLKRL